MESYKIEFADIMKQYLRDKSHDVDISNIEECSIELEEYKSDNSMIIKNGYKVTSRTGQDYYVRADFFNKWLDGAAIFKVK